MSLHLPSLRGATEWLNSQPLGCTRRSSGSNEKSERVLQHLLGVQREPVPVVGAGIEAAADWEYLQTPQTYLGALRGGGRHELHGEWNTEREFVALREGAGSIGFRFHARDVHLVLSAAAPIPFRVRLDGAPPGEAHGDDVDADGNGVLRERRLYQLIRQPVVERERKVEIVFAQAGVRAYASRLADPVRRGSPAALTASKTADPRVKSRRPARHSWPSGAT